MERAFCDVIGGRRDRPIEPLRNLAIVHTIAVDVNGEAGHSRHDVTNALARSVAMARAR